eukprot:scaffold1727_cov198-Alexandrium_tamarense.AAC.5
MTPTTAHLSVLPGLALPTFTTTTYKQPPYSLSLTGSSRSAAQKERDHQSTKPAPPPILSAMPIISNDEEASHVTEAKLSGLIVQAGTSSSSSSVESNVRIHTVRTSAPNTRLHNVNNLNNSTSYGRRRTPSLSSSSIKNELDKSDYSLGITSTNTWNDNISLLTESWTIGNVFPGCRASHIDSINNVGGGCENSSLGSLSIDGAMHQLLDHLSAKKRNIVGVEGVKSTNDDNVASCSMEIRAVILDVMGDDHVSLYRPRSLEVERRDSTRPTTNNKQTNSRSMSRYNPSEISKVVGLNEDESSDTTDDGSDSLTLPSKSERVGGGRVVGLGENRGTGRKESGTGKGTTSKRAANANFNRPTSSQSYKQKTRWETVFICTSLFIMVGMLSIGIVGVVWSKKRSMVPLFGGRDYKHEQQRSSISTFDNQSEGVDELPIQRQRSIPTATVKLSYTNEELFQLTERVMQSCAPHQLAIDKTSCQTFCRNEMCCFEQDERYNCLNDEEKRCLAFVGCLALVGSEIEYDDGS